MKSALTRLSGFKMTLFIILIVIFLMQASLILAQSGGGYTITKWTWGSSTNSGGGYSLTSYTSQIEPGAALTGNGYTLVGGYLAGAVSAQQPLYLPVILRQ